MPLLLFYCFANLAITIRAFDLISNLVYANMGESEGKQLWEWISFEQAIS